MQFHNNQPLILLHVKQFVDQNITKQKEAFLLKKANKWPGILKTSY